MIEEASPVGHSRVCWAGTATRACGLGTLLPLGGVWCLPETPLLPLVLALIPVKCPLQIIPCALPV